MYQDRHSQTGEDPGKQEEMVEKLKTCHKDWKDGSRQD